MTECDRRWRHDGNNLVELLPEQTLFNKAARSDLTPSGMVSDGRELSNSKEEENGGVEVSAEQETRPRPHFLLPPPLGRLPCSLGAGEEEQERDEGR